MSTSTPGNWQGDPDIPPRPVPFSERRHHRVPAGVALTPISIFFLFFDGEFWGKLARQTNVYATSEKFQNVHWKRRLRIGHHRPWTNATAGIMQQFVGLLITMGLNPKPRFDLYWSTEPIWQMPFFPSVMSADRFKDILKFLHVVDNRAHTDPSSRQDPLWKIRPFLDSLLSKFKKLYYPGLQLSLDEATCPFKGRVKFRVYNPKKPNKWGIKIYQLCDSATGYYCNFKIAAGEPSTTYDLVFNIMRDYLGRGHELYMDRYYTSVRLFQDLYLQKTVAVGTCMTNRRGLPKDLIKRKLAKGDVAASRHGSILALKWRDKREVFMLSTKHVPTMDVVVKETSYKTSVVKQKPTVVQNYNAWMSGVDNSDQLLQYYNFNRKTIKWWKKVFFHFLSLGIINAQKLYNFLAREQGCPQMKLLSFTQSLATDLVQCDLVRNAPVVPPPTHARVLPESFQHLPERISEDNPAKVLQCRVCREKHKKGCAEASQSSPRRTTFRCSHCKVPLCVDKCFKIYHTKENYWNK